MYEHKLILWKMAFRNLGKQKFQTQVMFLLLFISSVTLFFSNYLSRSMREGLEVTKERLGADLIVVPDRFVSGIEEALFTGKPCTVNFDKEWLDKIAKVDGVENVTYQLYIASLSVDCCDSSLQLIAFDKATDFVITPWLSDNGVKQLAQDEIVLGCNMKKKAGDKVKYFGRQFTVVDILSETGMGYDNCAFISYKAAYGIANDSRYDNILPFRKNQKVISMVLVKLKEGQTATAVKDKIQSSYPDSGITVYTTSSLVSRFANNLKDFYIYGKIFKALFLVLAVIALYGFYSSSIHLRKSEFGTFFSYGIDKRTILFMLMAEMLILVVTATVVGILTVCLFTLPFHEVIKNALAIPYLMPHMAEIILISGTTFVINLLVCIIASLLSFYKLAHLEGIQLIKSNNE